MFLLRELRYSARALAQRPGFSAVVILTLALGIGANMAIFSVVSAVLLRPLPYADPDRLVRVWSAFPEDDRELGTTSPLDLDDWREQATAFDAIAGYPRITMSGFVMTGGESPDEITTTHVTEDFFEVFGVPARSGRTLQNADHEEGSNRVVVLSHSAFSQRFGADPGIVGSTRTINGEPFIIVGVMPSGFEYPSAEVEMWAPISLIPDSGVPRRRPIRWLKLPYHFPVSICGGGAIQAAGLSALSTRRSPLTSSSTLNPCRLAERRERLAMSRNSWSRCRMSTLLASSRTIVPAPGRHETIKCSDNSEYACRTVWRLIFNCLASSRTGGRRSPGFRRPSMIDKRTSSTICT